MAVYATTIAPDYESEPNFFEDAHCSFCGVYIATSSGHHLEWCPITSGFKAISDSFCKLLSLATPFPHCALFSLSHQEVQEVLKWIHIYDRDTKRTYVTHDQAAEEYKSLFLDKYSEFLYFEKKRKQQILRHQQLFAHHPAVITMASPTGCPDCKQKVPTDQECMDEVVAGILDCASDMTVAERHVMNASSSSERIAKTVEKRKRIRFNQRLILQKKLKQLRFRSDKTVDSQTETITKLLKILDGGGLAFVQKSHGHLLLPSDSRADKR